MENFKTYWVFAGNPEIIEKNASMISLDREEAIEYANFLISGIWEEEWKYDSDEAVQDALNGISVWAVYKVDDEIDMERIS